MIIVHKNAIEGVHIFIGFEDLIIVASFDRTILE
jgi:hypothetical protein